MAPIAISPPASPFGAPPAAAARTTRSLSSSPSSINQYRGYDHVHWYVGNAKQAASYYVTRMGFTRIAYRGLETGSRVVASHVVANGDVTFVLTSPLRGVDGCDDNLRPEEREQLREIHDHLRRHGDGVKDVSFEVDSVDAVYEAAVKNGAKVISEPRILSSKEGEVKVATVKTYGDTTHTLVERADYHGTFLPGYRSEIGRADPLSGYLPTVEFDVIDHCVGNQDWGEMEQTCE